MIELHKDGTSIDTFDDYLALYQYLSHQENLKLFDDPPQTEWSFHLLSPERVANLINTLKKEYDKPLLYEARDRKLCLLEICEGNYQKKKSSKFWLRRMLMWKRCDMSGVFRTVRHMTWRSLKLKATEQPLKPQAMERRGQIPWRSVPHLICGIPRGIAS